MKKIITISREFGSGGRTVGRMVAEKLGIPFYDKEIIEKAAEETGFTESFISEHGEHSAYKNIFAYSFIGRTFDGMSADDYIWSIQRKIIRDLAEKGPCVIVGRCADYILQDRDDCLHAFIHADIASRAKRIVEKYGETSDSPEKRLADKDKKRRNNYKYYTDREWGMSQNYDISLDSSTLGLERCADIIVELAKIL
ncbi:MAG: cytidylate kinase-like family protein [Firmicutes bacterium]|nr:cytidylate kinase-like family protein [Bacillota bacterium]